MYKTWKSHGPPVPFAATKVFLAKWRETLVAAKVLVTADGAAAAAAAAASSGSSSALSLSSPTIEALQKEAGLMAALR